MNARVKRDLTSTRSSRANKYLAASNDNLAMRTSVLHNTDDTDDIDLDFLAYERREWIDKAIQRASKDDKISDAQQERIIGALSLFSVGGFQGATKDVFYTSSSVKNIFFEHSDFIIEQSHYSLWIDFYLKHAIDFSDFYDSVIKLDLAIYDGLKEMYKLLAIQGDTDLIIKQFVEYVEKKMSETQTLLSLYK